MSETNEKKNENEKKKREIMKSNFLKNDVNLLRTSSVKDDF